jgi:predicted DNA binding protein
MERTIQFLKIYFIFYTLTIFSCTSKDKIDTKNIFEKAVKKDSLTYYFPEILNDTFEPRNPHYKDFEQNWYSSSLFAFKEPILFNRIDSQTIYRLLWLPSFHQPVCISVKEFNGDYFINSKTLDRQPQFYPTIELKDRDRKTGKEILDTINKGDRFALISFDTVKILRSGQWREIENYLEKLDFWNSPVADPADEGTTDGSNWIIEGRKNNKYHFINRRNARNDLMKFGKYLIEISGLKINSKDIY